MNLNRRMISYQHGYNLNKNGINCLRDCTLLKPMQKEMT